MQGGFLGALMKYPIHFIDDNGNPTTDYVDGLPVMPIDIDVSIKPPTQPNTEIQIYLTRLLAVVDTGANSSMVSQGLLQGQSGTPRSRSDQYGRRGNH